MNIGEKAILTHDEIIQNVSEVRMQVPERVFFSQQKGWEHFS